MQGARVTAHFLSWPALPRPEASPAAAMGGARQRLAHASAGLATLGMIAANVLRATSGNYAHPTPGSSHHITWRRNVGPFLGDLCVQERPVVDQDIRALMSTPSGSGVQCSVWSGEVQTRMRRPHGVMWRCHVTIARVRSFNTDRETLSAGRGMCAPAM